MSLSLLPSTSQESALSVAYATAIAAGAGFVTSKPDFDLDSVDLTISAGGSMRPKIDIQLKATVNLPLRKGNYVFPISLKNYDDLRAPVQTPRLLVVLAMPKDQPKWISVSVRQLVLRKAAFWVSLKGKGDVSGQKTVSVYIPKHQVFDVGGLVGLMGKSQQGTL